MNIDKVKLGSDTTKGGFKNEDTICQKINLWQKDLEAQNCLAIMGYNLQTIQKVQAYKIAPRINSDFTKELGVNTEYFTQCQKYKKADIQIQVEITIDNILHRENISLKKANTQANYNQVDKRTVKTCQEMWGFNENIAKNLKLFTGEFLSDKQDRINKKRLFLTELASDDLQELIDFFTAHKFLIISDIIKERGALSAEWLLVTKQNIDGTKSFLLKNINLVCDYYASGKVELSPRASLKIGKITMQRKGGTPDPTSLQFKINPLELFNL